MGWLLRSTPRFPGVGAFGFCEALPALFRRRRLWLLRAAPPCFRRWRLWLLRSTPRFCGVGAFGICELPPVFPTLAPLASAKHHSLLRRRRLWLLRAAPRVSDVGAFGFCELPPCFRRWRLWLLRS